MLTIVYDPTPSSDATCAIADGFALDEVRIIIEDYREACETAARDVDCTVTICNEILIDAFRLAVRQGKIFYEDLEFEFQGQKIKVNEEGRIAYWPPGFGDLQSKLLRELAEPIPADIETATRMLKRARDKQQKDQQQ